MIEVRVEDLAFYSGHAVIRPATATLGATTPLLRRFELAGGPKLLQQLAVADPLPVGSAVVTGAGDLPVELLVHAVVMSATERVTRDGVRRALRSALQRTREWQLADVAIPPLGLGAGNLAIEDSAELMADELRVHRQSSEFPRRVTLVAETPDEATALEYAVTRGVA
jgi:O-acetyl-ADP-ribose deacetylase (regulator of RNase III)